MSPAIRIENLSKRYIVSHEGKPNGYKTLRESLVDMASAPLRRLRGKHQVPSDEFWALKDVSFEVKPGEVVGVIGRNGAGKSTLLKILSQITKPTCGRITLNGRIGSLLEVGTGFHPELTGRENVFLNGSILGMSRREVSSKFDEIVAFAEVERFLDTPVKRYSSGMYVRLAFAVAAHLEPEILIVDEVLAVGDSLFQKKCMGKLNDVAANGRTVFFVSHNLIALQSLCTRGVLLKAGELVYDGSIHDAAKEYTAITKGASGGGADLPPHSVIRSVRLLDSDGNAQTVFRAKADITIELILRCTRTLRSPVVGVGITNELGTRVSTVSTLFTGGMPPDVGSGIVRCVLPGISLVPGEYNIRIGIDDAEGLSQRMEDVSTFQVLPPEDGAYPGSVHGVVALNSSWSYCS